MSLKGIDIIGTGAPIVVEASLKDASGAKITTGSATVSLYEFQSDGTLKSYDFNSNTFKTTALTTATAALTHRTGNNSTVNTGVWTYAHATVTGFTRGSRYMWQVSHASAIPPQQERKFQYGDGEGDLTVASTGHALSDVSDVSLSEIFKAIYRCQSVVFVNENADDDLGDGLKPSTAKKTIDAGAGALGFDGGLVLFPGAYTASTATFTTRTALFGAGPNLAILNGTMTFSGSNRTDGIALGGTIGITAGTLAVSDYLAFGTPAFTGTVVGLDGVRPATLLRPVLVDAAGRATLAPTQTFDNTATWTGSMTGSIGSLSTQAKTDVENAVWNASHLSHTNAGTFGFNVDASISGVSTGGLSASTIAVAVWNELQAAHTTPGSYGVLVDSQLSGIATNVNQSLAYVSDIHTTAAHLDTMLVLNGSVYRYTAGALALGPAGGGSGGTIGSGADSCTMTISRQGSGIAIADADVWITSDLAGTAVVAGTLQTNSAGQVTFLLDAGVTYYLWMQKDGENSILGWSFVAVAD